MADLTVPGLLERWDAVVAERRAGTGPEYAMQDKIIADTMASAAAELRAALAAVARPAEGNTDLHGDTDAAHWAERFAATFEVRRLSDIGNRGIVEPLDTMGLMLAWFAGAIETGRMAAAPDAMVLDAAAAVLERMFPAAMADEGQAGIAPRGCRAFLGYAANVAREQ